jgi:hypothetical protein
MKKFALMLSIPFLMSFLCSLAAMEEEHFPLIGKVNMRYLREESSKIGKTVRLDVTLSSSLANDTAEEEKSFESLSLPSEVTIEFIFQNFQHLKEILDRWQDSYDGAKICVKAWIEDPSHKERVNGFDFIDFKADA